MAGDSSSRRELHERDARWLRSIFWGLVALAGATLVMPAWLALSVVATNGGNSSDSGNAATMDQIDRFAFLTGGPLVLCGGWLISMYSRGEPSCRVAVMSRAGSRWLPTCVGLAVLIDHVVGGWTEGWVVLLGGVFNAIACAAAWSIFRRMAFLASMMQDQLTPKQVVFAPGLLSPFNYSGFRTTIAAQSIVVTYVTTAFLVVIGIIPLIPGERDEVTTISAACLLLILAPLAWMFFLVVWCAWEFDGARQRALFDAKGHMQD